MDGLDTHIARSTRLAMRDHTVGIWTAYVTRGYSLFFFFFWISLQNKVQMFLNVELLCLKTHNLSLHSHISGSRCHTVSLISCTNFATVFQACGLLTVTNFWDSIRHFRPSDYSTLFTTLSLSYLNAREWCLLFSKSCCSGVCKFEICKRFRALIVCRFLVTRHGYSAWALSTESEEQPGRKGDPKQSVRKICTHRHEFKRDYCLQNTYIHFLL